MAAWLGTVSAAHVRRGVSLGIAQIGHGRRDGLRRMASDDWLVYYSPTEIFGEGPPVRAFTAVGRVVDDEIFQAEEDDGSRPWRRRVDYLGDSTPAPVASLKDRLELTAGPNWGYQLRRGLIALSAADLSVIRTAMGVPE